MVATYVPHPLRPAREWPNKKGARIAPDAPLAALIPPDQLL